MKRGIVRYFSRIVLGIHLSGTDYMKIGYYLKANSNHFFLNRILRERKRQIGITCGLEIDNFDRIGSNLVLSHPYGITVNPKVTIGNDCVLFKGCTLGSIRSGFRGGVPQIGNRVVIGINATVVGNITVGDDVLIAANSFVDFDVPDNSLVLGNPGIIHRKEKASKDYV